MLYQLNQRLGGSSDTQKPSNISIVATIGTVVLLLAIFAAIALGVKLTSGPLPGDLAVLRSIRSIAFPELDKILAIGTEVGSAVVVIAITILISIFLFWKRKLFEALFLLASVGGVSMLNFILKHTFERNRPTLWDHLVTETGFSFPSGHAMVSCAFAFSIIILCWRTKFRIPALLIGSTYIAMIGFSRLYVGVHYPTDILAAWCVSASWVVIVYGIIQLIKNRF